MLHRIHNRIAILSARIDNSRARDSNSNIFPRPCAPSTRFFALYNQCFERLYLIIGAVVDLEEITLKPGQRIALAPSGAGQCWKDDDFEVLGQ